MYLLFSQVRASTNASDERLARQIPDEHVHLARITSVGLEAERSERPVTRASGVGRF